VGAVVVEYPKAKQQQETANGSLGFAAVSINRT